MYKIKNRCGLVEEDKERETSAQEGAKEEGKITITLPKINVPKVNPWIVSTVILLLLSIVLFVRPQVFGRAVTTGAVVVKGSMEAIGSDEAGQKAVDYINNNLVQGADKATFVSAEEFTTDMYKVTTKYQGNTIDVYITKDGKWLFVSSPFDTTAPTTTTQPQQQPTPEVPKSDKPEAHAFVMSYCPFGLQFLKAYVPVMELLGDRADLQVNFVDYAMHGEKEVYENLRMYCIQAEQKEKFTDYLRCFVEAGDYEGCIDKVGIDKDALQTCMDETDEKFKITEKLNDKSTWDGRFPPFDVEADMNSQYGVRGSPTFVLNGQRVSVDRSPEAIKDAICAAFNNPPAECEQELSTAAESPGLGPIGSGSGSASSSGGCA